MGCVLTAKLQQSSGVCGSGSGVPSETPLMLQGTTHIPHLSPLCCLYYYCTVVGCVDDVSFRVNSRAAVREIKIPRRHHREDPPP